MNKKLFIKTIKALKKQSDLDNTICEHLSKAFPNAFGADLFPQNGILQNAIVEILQTEFKDKENDWIGYYLYELDFGSENDRLQVFDKDDKEIPLKTAEDLYNILTNK